MSGLDAATRKRLLRLMLVSRQGDLREQSLIRQGRGWFHVSGMGHEALVAVGALLREGDFFAGYYRDRPIALGRGMSNFDLALAFFAKASSASGGRQMPAHYSDRSRGIYSVPSVVAGNLMAACGLAWGIQLDGKPNAVVTTVGDAGTRQGDFYECLCFAKERGLPLLVLVEDNGIGISSVTSDINPMALGLLEQGGWEQVDGCSLEAVHTATSTALEAIRSGGGPRFLWCRTERISSHSSADDHRKYRSSDELSGLEDKDPVNRLKAALIQAGELSPQGFLELQEAVTAEVRADYERAYEERDPDPETLEDHVFARAISPPPLQLPRAEKWRMVDAINQTFHAALQRDRDVVFFGQDIADPKGGVFSLTKGLSDAFPDNVTNSPLAESTILGASVGLSAYGKRPVFEIQFTDYIWPGFNQIVTHLSTLHWRTCGEWTAAPVLYAPYGGYLPAGALWHSQANEALLAHLPGLQVVIPSSPEDAAGLLWSALHDDNPTFFLIPKHLLWHAVPYPEALRPIPLGKAAVLREGSGVTVLTWGNCREVVEAAADELPAGEVEVIDLRSLVPLDEATLEASVRKTGRLLIVQEDAERCSFGEHLLQRLLTQRSILDTLQATPRLLAKPNVHVPYHPDLEAAALPQQAAVVAALRALLAEQTAQRPRSVSAAAAAAPAQAPTPTALAQLQETFGDRGEAPTERYTITVPMLGEGITSARVAHLLADAGSAIEADDGVCELETDKALFPVEAPRDGTLIEWLVAEGDEVEIDQPLAHVELPAAATPAPTPAQQAPATAGGEEEPSDALARPPRPTEGGLAPHIVAQLKNVVPAHMTVKVGWSTLREARRQAKADPASAHVSPTMMLAWSLVRAMEQHPIFTCTVRNNGTLSQHRAFDFGIAVSLQNDALDTAVLESANTLPWEQFCVAYDAAVEAVRKGQRRSKAGVPLILTSMGGFGVRDALPSVVPPAIGTLFVGEAHYDFAPDGQSAQVVSLCLSFDHRWINGVAGAQFLSDVRTQIEQFSLPVTR